MQESIVDFHGYFTRLIYLKRSRDSICVTCFIHVNLRGSPCRSRAYVDLDVESTGVKSFIHVN